MRDFAELCSDFEDKLSILHTVVQLAETTPIDDITVKMICDQEKISKQTFYKCFSNKQDILLWVGEVIGRPNIAQVGVLFSWEEALKRFLSVIEQEKHLLAVLYRSKSVTHPQYRFDNLLTIETMERNAKRHYANGEVPELIKFQIRCHARTFSELMRDWILGYIDYDEETFVRYLISVIPTDLYELFKHPIKAGAEWDALSGLSGTNVFLRPTLVYDKTISNAS